MIQFNQRQWTNLRREKIMVFIRVSCRGQHKQKKLTPKLSGLRRQGYRNTRQVIDKSRLVDSSTITLIGSGLQSRQQDGEQVTTFVSPASLGSTTYILSITAMTAFEMQGTSSTSSADVFFPDIATNRCGSQ